MVLEDTHDIHEVVLGLKDLLDFLIGGLLSNDLRSHQLLRGMQVGAHVSSLLLLGGSARKVTCPEVFRVVTVWETIIVLGRPANLVLLKSVKVQAGRRVLKCHIDIVVLVHILNNCIHLVVAQSRV